MDAVSTEGAGYLLESGVKLCTCVTWKLSRATWNEELERTSPGPSPSGRFMKYGADECECWLISRLVGRGAGGVCYNMRLYASTLCRKHCDCWANTHTVRQGAQYERLACAAVSRRRRDLARLMTAGKTEFVKSEPLLMRNNTDLYPTH